MKTSVFPLVIVVVGFVAAPPRPVHAEARATETELAAQVLRLNRDAMELFESLEFSLAREQLFEALRIGQGLGAHWVLARTHGNLGLIFAIGLKDDALALEHFTRALTIRPDFRVPKEISTPEVEALLLRARDNASAPPRLAEAAGALRCPSSGEAAAGDDIDLRCLVSGSLQPASLTLYYKRAGDEEFVAVPMTGPVAGATRAAWTARIPGSHVSGKWIPFFFEARDRAGKTLAFSGRNESPNIISVKADTGDAPTTTGTLDSQVDEENPLKPANTSVSHRTWFMGLGVGTGAGYASGPGVETYRNLVRGFTPGVAPAGRAHATPEIGFYLGPRTALAVQGRLQYIQSSDSLTARGAFAGLIRLMQFSNTGPARFYGTLAAGGGDGFRLLVQAKTTDGGLVNDTVRGGPFVAGAGGGFTFDLSQAWSLMVESLALAGFPDFSVVVDVNAGLRFNY